MAKTSRQIQSDVYQLLASSPIASAITGKVYRDGFRPEDSRLEDVVVIFTSGLPSEIQTGVVTINVYVPDIDPSGIGKMIENSRRTEELEGICADWVSSLGSANYLFSLQNTIYTEADRDSAQHFIVIKLTYKFYGDDRAPMDVNEYNKPKQ